MDKLINASLVIDWGFSRFKSWLYDSNGQLIKYDYLYTCDFCLNNTIYYDDDLAKLLKYIFNFLDNLDCVVNLSLYSSSQMHCAGVVSSSYGSVLSTWNDLPSFYTSKSITSSINGIPFLPSMPLHKFNLKTPRPSSYLFNKINSKCDQGLIDYFASPVGLLFTEVFKSKLPCTLSWWQSTCLPSDILSISGDRGSYLSEQPLYLSPQTLNSFHPKVNSILYFPEIGDLQASTYASCSKHDIIINLGTGSQVIVSNPELCPSYSYFRFWPLNNIKYPVISHVPCGRLLQRFIEFNNLSFSDLSDALFSLTSQKVLQIADSTPQSLLFFPGYCFFADKYIDSNFNSIEQICSLDVDVLLSLWVYQYRQIIKSLLRHNFNSGGSLSIVVTGSLGGLSVLFINLLQQIMPSPFVVSYEKTELPQSLMSIFAENN